MRAIILCFILFFLFSTLFSDDFDYLGYTVGYQYCDIVDKGKGDNEYDPVMTFNLLGVTGIGEDLFMKWDFFGYGLTKNVVGESEQDLDLFEWVTLRIGPVYGWDDFRIIPYGGGSCSTFYLKETNRDSEKQDNIISLKTGLAFNVFDNVILYGEYSLRCWDDMGHVSDFQLKIDIAFLSEVE